MDLAHSIRLHWMIACDYLNITRGIYPDILGDGMYAKLKGNMREWHCWQRGLCLHLEDGAKVSGEPWYTHTHGRKTWVIDMHSLDKPIADIHEQESRVSLSNCWTAEEQINRKFISNISDALHQQKVSEAAATFPEHFNIDLTKFVTYFKPRGTSQRSNCILKWDPRADGQAQNICNIQN